MMRGKEFVKSENGVVMVEAAIYFPIVICVVVTMLYYGLFILQEAAMNYEVHRMTAYASKDASNPGYGEFPIASGNEVEFEYAGDQPSAEQVKAYYNAYHNRIGSLYRGVAGILCGEKYDYDAVFGQMVKNGLLFHFTVSPEVEVEKTLFGTSVVASVEYSVPMPGVARYLGLEEQMVIRSASYCHAVNPSDFVRNTDLAVDLVEFAAEKLGVSNKLDVAIGKAKNIINKIF